MISLFMYMYIIVTTLYFLNFYSILNCLLFLESISLILFFGLLNVMIMYISFKVSLLYFVFIVSESSIGLSILVKSIKFYSVNSFRTMNVSLF